MKIGIDNINNIIFDLGNVLLNLNFNATVEAFKELGFPKRILDEQQSYPDSFIYALEVGKITPAEFYARIRAQLKNKQITNKQIEVAWCAMLLDMPLKRIAKLRELRKSHKLFLFSNTNEIHIKWALKTFKKEHSFDLHTLFDKVFYSHEINDRKPEVSSFEKVIQLSGIQPNRTLFVDDLKKNIIGAEKVGLKTLWLEDHMEMANLF